MNGVSVRILQRLPTPLALPKLNSSSVLCVRNNFLEDIARLGVEFHGVSGGDSVVLCWRRKKRHWIGIKVVSLALLGFHFFRQFIAREDLKDEGCG